jgi:beta-phosphoglucomutase-like phosphatase (HAD superfamily)
LAVAFSSNRPIIDLVLELGGLDRYFRATVSSEEVQHGKPNGILAAKAGGMRVVAIPNRRCPPGEVALAEVDVALEDISELTPEAVEGTG